ncbi:hypothetical protein ACS0TY_013359 [Phlomoides rotata]
MAHPSSPAAAAPPSAPATGPEPVSDAYTTPNESQKQQQIPHREEGVKEKIILSQEKSIQRLTELVRDLKEQLQQCQSNNETSIGAFSS